jgi:hypothetical protein
MPALANEPRTSLPIEAATSSLLWLTGLRGTSTAVALVLLAFLFTLLNCLKPLHVDDTCYVVCSTHIAEHPLSPYEGMIYWDYHLQKANDVLAPPVMLYWLAVIRAALGNSPLVWKLSLLPWHLMLVGALFVLFRRWAGPLALPLTWMTVLSPAVLPSTNLMLDVPALALSLAAVALMFQAIDRGSWTLALLAGSIGGVAMQTKYSALVTPFVLLACGWTHRRLRLALPAAGMGVLLFAAWEAFVVLQLGDSHFLVAAQRRSGALGMRIPNMFLPTFTLTAALAPGVFFLAILAWKRSGRWLAGGIVLVASGLLVLGVIPGWLNAVWIDPTTGRAAVKLDGALYGVMMVIWWSVLAVVVSKWWRNQRKPLARALFLHAHSPLHGASERQAVMRFLFLWLALEFAGAMALSPFPAARRILGVAVVTTFVVGFIAARKALTRRLVWTAVGAAMCFGLAVALIDMGEAQATKELAEAAMRFAKRENPEGRTWFSGAWSFQFYTMAAGLMPVDPHSSELRAGDLLILTQQQLRGVDFQVADAPLAKVAAISLEDNMPWQTLMCYYCGCTPVQHHEGPRLRLTAYRVLADFVPIDHGILQTVD